MSRTRKEPKFSWLRNMLILLDFELDPIRAFIKEATVMIDNKTKKLNEDYKKLEEEIKNNPQKYFDSRVCNKLCLLKNY